MVEKYYIDACIWIDLHENRTDRFRPLGEWAFELFRRIRKNRDRVLYSELIIEELSKDFDEEKINGMFSIVSEEDLLEKVEINEEQLKKAAILKKKLKDVPFGDCLHAILAGDNQSIMVTRDHHFYELQDTCTIKKAGRFNLV